MKRNKSKMGATNRKITISDTHSLIPTSILQEFSNLEVSFCSLHNSKDYDWTIMKWTPF